MQQDSLNFIKQIELINDYILDECQEYLYYTPQSNSCIFERIKNASMLLLNNAMRILRNQSPIIKSSENALTIEKTKELMFKMYQTILLVDFPVSKENKIKKIMQEEFSLNPSELLYLPPSEEKQERQTRYILQGNF